MEHECVFYYDVTGGKEVVRNTLDSFRLVHDVLTYVCARRYCLEYTLFPFPKGNNTGRIHCVQKGSGVDGWMDVFNRVGLDHTYPAFAESCVGHVAPETVRHYIVLQFSLNKV